MKVESGEGDSSGETVACQDRRTRDTTYLIVAEPFQWDRLGCSRSAMCLWTGKARTG